ncbi:MAG: hypothetical protein JW717_00290 [Marinilabiliaceae bacterium]|nr:hypothetical protein [Marinilabiliaceae bacterium]
MKIKNLLFLITAALLTFSACTPDEYKLSTPNISSDELIEGLSYTITHDSVNQNIVYLESLVDAEYTPLWSHPLGRSQSKKVTLNIPFEGTYDVIFGVITRGGIIYGDTVHFTIDKFCADFVQGEMWDALTGGNGKSKTWIPDNGNYNMKQGFYSCFDPSATYVDMIADDGKNNWYADGKTWWEPSNDDVGITEDDLKSFMTFSLMGKAGLEVHRFNGGVETVTNGIFNMDAENHIINAIDVDFVHGAWADGKAVDFRTGFQILVINENQLMIANYRDEALSGEGRCIYCWNFVSKDYADNYKPEEIFDFKLEEKYADSNKKNWQEYISGITDWTLSSESPFDWFTLKGERINSYASPNAYPANMTPITNTDKIAMRTSFANGTFTFFDLNDNRISDSIFITEDGYIKFGKSLPTILIGGDFVNFNLDENNRLRVLEYELTSEGLVSDMWVGIKQYDNQSDAYQYLAYHFVTGYVDPGYTAQMSFFNSATWANPIDYQQLILDEGEITLTYNGTSADVAFDGWYIDILKIKASHPNATMEITKIELDGTEKTFDGTLLDYEATDDKNPNTLRVYICNPWGYKVDDPATTETDESAFLNPTEWQFSTSISVTIDLKYND